MTTEELEALRLKRIANYTKQIESIFNKAATEAASIGQLFNATDLFSKPFSFADYPITKERIDKLMKEMSAGIQATVVNGVTAEWKNSNYRNDEIAQHILGLKPDDELHTGKFKKYFNNNDKALQAFIQRKDYGLNLSDRVWKYTEKFKSEIELGLDTGIRAGLPASEMARDLKQYLQHPDKLFRRVRDQHGNLKLSKAAAAFHPGQGVYRSSYKNAMRLTRTETNMAYRAADHARFQDWDFIVGIEVRLSNNPGHITDICDDLKGKYPKDFKFVGWHPHCMCHTVTILKTQAEIDADVEKIANGEQTDGASRNAVKEMPGNFKEWAKENQGRIATAKNMPYFIKDNFTGTDTSKWFIKPVEPAKVADFIVEKFSDSIQPIYDKYLSNLKDINITFSSDSVTDYGRSTYFKAARNGKEVKVRVSNHTTTNKDRSLSEIHFDSMKPSNHPVNIRAKNRLNYEMGIDGYKYGKTKVLMPNGKYLDGFDYYYKKPKLTKTPEQKKTIQEAWNDRKIINRRKQIAEMAEKRHAARTKLDAFKTQAKWDDRTRKLIDINTPVEKVAISKYNLENFRSAYKNRLDTKLSPDQAWDMIAEANRNRLRITPEFITKAKTAGIDAAEIDRLIRIAKMPTSTADSFNWRISEMEHQIEKYEKKIVSVPKQKITPAAKAAIQKSQVDIPVEPAKVVVPKVTSAKTPEQQLLEALNTVKNPLTTPEQLLKTKEIKQIMDGTFAEDTDQWIQDYWSHPNNYKPKTYHRYEGAGEGVAGMGNGLYLGRDLKALNSFYNQWGERELKLSTFKGEPKWLDIIDPRREKAWYEYLNKKGINPLNSNALGEIVKKLGYDGIKYFDARATGEEYVLFNTKALKKVARAKLP